MTTVKTRGKAGLEGARVLERRDLSPELTHLWLERPEGFSFKAGQYCTIGLDGVERAYSIVSAPHEDFLELFIELVPSGELTPRLWRLEVGGHVTIRPRAKGIFTFDPRSPDQLMIATVTGIVPFVSMLRDYLHRAQDGHRFHVMHGASYVEELAYRQELEEMARRHPSLISYVPTVSRPSSERNEGWHGQVGRVNTLVEEYVERHGLHAETTLVYACGHPGMIEDTKARLLPRGFSLKEERFWKED